MPLAVTSRWLQQGETNAHLEGQGKTCNLLNLNVMQMAPVYFLNNALKKSGLHKDKSSMPSASLAYWISCSAELLRFKIFPAVQRQHFWADCKQ